jgi:hypothetical protein
MAQEIVSLLRHPDLRDKLGQAAAAHMQRHYAWDLLAERAEDYYRSS